MDHQRRRTQLREQEATLRSRFKVAVISSALTGALATFVPLQQDQGQLFDLHKMIPEKVQTELAQNPEADPVSVSIAFNDLADSFEDLTRSAGLFFFSLSLIPVATRHLKLRAVQKELNQYAPRP